MQKSILPIILWLIPIVIGGIIATINSEAVNNITEKFEAWVRRTQANISQKGNWFYKYILNPILWIVVKFSDWTDSFTHRGLKNGLRVTITLYLIIGWCFLLYVLFVVAIILLLAGVILYVLFKVLSGSSQSEQSTSSTRSAQTEILYKPKNIKMAGVNFSIRVVDENGYPISNARIYLCRTPLLDPWNDTQYTDSDGWANCEYDDCIGCDSVSLGIEINGDNMGEHMFYDGSTKSFTLS